jgi:hypothetical protein
LALAMNSSPTMVGWAAIRPFEQHHAKLALDLVQPAAQGRLAYVQSFRRLSQAAVL